MALIQIDTSDLHKIGDALAAASAFFEYRDRMNGTVHLAAQTRFSPITSVVQAEMDRVRTLLEAQEEE
jgi:hypothetical protein